MTLFAEHIPKHHGAGFAFEIIDLKLFRALENFRIISPRLTQPCEVAFHVRHEYRHTTRAEIFRERLERDRFPRSGGAGDQTVAVRHLWKQKDLFFRLGDENGIDHNPNRKLGLVRRQTPDAEHRIGANSASSESCS